LKLGFVEPEPKTERNNNHQSKINNQISTFWISQQTLTDWFSQPICSVFTARYGLDV